MEGVVLESANGSNYNPYTNNIVLDIDFFLGIGDSGGLVSTKIYILESI